MSAPSPGFAGDLGAFSLPDLIQTVVLGGKTARIALRPRKRAGDLWFSEGKLVHAEAGPLSGDPAVYEMLSWTEGEFSVEYDATTDRRSIEQEATFLVLEGVRRLDESRSVAPEPRPPVRAVRPSPRPRSRRLSPAAIAASLIVAVVTVAVIAGAGSTPGPYRAPELEWPVDDLLTPIERAAVRPPIPKTFPEPAPPPPRAKRDAPPLAPAAEPLPPESATGPLPAVEDLEALSGTPLEHAPVLDPQPAEVPATAFLRISGKSWVEDGSLLVLVDEEPVFSRALERRHGGFARAMRRIVAAGDERFEAEVPVPAGTRRVVVEVDTGPEGAIHREALEAEFAPQRPRSLRITAGRAVGSPLRVRFD
jgi:hypothetical protein